MQSVWHKRKVILHKCAIERMACRFRPPTLVEGGREFVNGVAVAKPPDDVVAVAQSESVLQVDVQSVERFMVQSVALIEMIVIGLQTQLRILRKRMGPATKNI